MEDYTLLDMLQEDIEVRTMKNWQRKRNFGQNVSKRKKKI